MTQKKVKLGDRVRDEITDFEGIIIQRSEYLNGCVTCEIMPKVNEKGEIQDSVFIDEAQLILIEDNGNEDEPEGTGGGVRKHPPKRR